MKKIFVLDTNILLINPQSLFHFEDNDVVVPISVIEEVDTFKKGQSELAKSAREVSRLLDKLRKNGSLAEGVSLGESKGRLYVCLGDQRLDEATSLAKDSTDNHILAVSLQLKAKHGETPVILITKDSNLRIKADAFGIEAEDYTADKVDISCVYTGGGDARVIVSEEKINELFVKRSLVLKAESNPPYSINEYVTLESSEDDGREVYAVVKESDECSTEFELVDSLAKDNVWGLRARNNRQLFALDALLNDDIKLVTLSGGAGTGKTLLAIAAGLARISDGEVYHKLLVSRPIFPLGRDLGHLPGDLSEKLNPWMQPIFDNLELLMSDGLKGSGKKKHKFSGGGAAHQELINQGLLQIEALTYIRGRSLPHIYFIVDEAQNLTQHEIKTILTRAGEGTKIVLTGDPNQIDNPYVDTESNGLTYVIKKFKGQGIAAHVTLDKGERSELATVAAELL